MNSKIATTFLPSPVVLSGGTVSAEEDARLRADRIIGQIKNLRWKHQLPLRYFSQLLDLLGLPDVFDETPGGTAIWRQKKLQRVLDTHCVKIVDECVPFACLGGEQCCGFVYLCVDYDTRRCSCVDQLATLSTHVIIDVEKQTIKARSNNLQSCVAILAVFTGVGACRMSASQAKMLQATDKAVKLVEENPNDFLPLLHSLQDNLQKAKPLLPELVPD